MSPGEEKTAKKKRLTNRGEPGQKGDALEVGPKSADCMKGGWVFPILFFYAHAIPTRPRRRHAGTKQFEEGTMMNAYLKITTDGRLELDSRGRVVGWAVFSTAPHREPVYGSAGMAFKDLYPPDIVSAYKAKMFRPMGVVVEAVTIARLAGGRASGLSAIRWSAVAGTVAAMMAKLDAWEQGVWEAKHGLSLSTYFNADGK